MSYIMQAIRIKLILNKMSVAKENAMREFMGLPPRLPWYEKCWISITKCLKETICEALCPCCFFNPKRKRRIRCGKWCTEGTFQYQLVTQTLAFLCGILLAFVLHMVMIYQMAVKPQRAQYVTSGFGLVLSLGMAFSSKFRCFILLMLPQFFSGKGRMFLLLYALYLTTETPVANFNRNILVMSESSTCGQEMAFNKTKELVKAATQPMTDLIENIKDVIETMKEFAERMKRVYTRLKSIAEEMGSTMKKVGDWLVNMVDMCNDKIGAPYRRCKAAFDHAESECKDLLPPLIDLACNVVSWVGNICNIARIGELMCLLAKLISDLIENSIAAEIKTIVSNIETMFYFKVNIDYQFNWTMSQSKSYKEIRDDIKGEVMDRISNFMKFVEIFHDLTILALLLVVIKAAIYYHKYLSVDRYDNMYISYELQLIDHRKKEKGKEGILPLNFEEEKKYVKTKSARMVSKEMKKLAIGLVFFSISAFNTGFYLLCDYGLYFMLSLIKKHFTVKNQKLTMPAHAKIHVDGGGPMGDMYKSLVSMFDPMVGFQTTIDNTPCVPRPYEPDFNVYRQIGLIYLLCLIMTITEAYGLRFRHVIMACYHPKREKYRAAWLYSHIQKTRGPMMESLKNAIQRNNSEAKEERKVSMLAQLSARFPIIGRCLKFLGYDRIHCLGCAMEGRPEDHLNFIRCINPACDAVYCLNCFADLDNICSLCSDAVDVQGSDVSEEMDSSIDEEDLMKRKEEKRIRDARIEEMKDQKKASNVLARFRETMGIVEPISGATGPIASSLETTAEGQNTPSQSPTTSGESSVDTENMTGSEDEMGSGNDTGSSDGTSSENDTGSSDDTRYSNSTRYDDATGSDNAIKYDGQLSRDGSEVVHLAQSSIVRPESTTVLLYPQRFVVSRRSSRNVGFQAPVYLHSAEDYRAASRASLQNIPPQN